MLARHVAVFCTWILFVMLCSPAFAENWPMWRGPRGDGTSSEEKLPTTWNETENIAWKVEIPGEGHASPIVWEDRVFVTSCLPDGQRVLLCLNRLNGETLWQQTVITTELENIHKLNSRASSTPATDGKFVYATFLEPSGEKKLFKDDRYITPGQIVLAAYDFAGKQQWLVRIGEFSSIHGFSSPPVLWEDRVLINGDHDGESYLMALNKTTGETLWKTPRENHTRSYSTPIVREIAGRPQMMLAGNMCVASYDPRDGSRQWIIDGPTEQFVASVVYNGEFLFLTGGYPDHHMLAVRPDGSGNVTETHIAWRTTDSASYVPSPIAAEKYFLVVSDAGIASPFDAATGERSWRQRIGRRYSASLIAGGGLVYFTSDDGETQVVRPGEKYDLVSENKLGEQVFASPAISQGQIFFRGVQHLYCIGK
jgi:outer membrane protein assembly factor BamB